MNGGDDETRTRDLCRDTFNDMEEHGRHCKSLEVHHRQRYCVSRCVSRRPPGVMRGQTVSSEWPAIRESTTDWRPIDQLPRSQGDFYLTLTTTLPFVRPF